MGVPCVELSYTARCRKLARSCTQLYTSACWQLRCWRRTDLSVAAQRARGSVSVWRPIAQGQQLCLANDSAYWSR